MESLLNFIVTLLYRWFSDYDVGNVERKRPQIIEIRGWVARKAVGHRAEWWVESLEKFKDIQINKSFKRVEFSAGSVKRCHKQRL